MLKIHPLLTVDEGVIDQYGKVRTLQKAYQAAIEVITKDIDVDDYTWMIIDADNAEGSSFLKGILSEKVHEA